VTRIQSNEILGLLKGGLNSVTRIQSNEILGLLKGGLNIQRF